MTSLLSRMCIFKNFKCYMSFFYSAAAFCEKTIGFIKNFVFISLNTVNWFCSTNGWSISDSSQWNARILVLEEWAVKWLKFVSSLQSPSSNYPVKYTYELLGFLFWTSSFFYCYYYYYYFFYFLYTGRRKGKAALDHWLRM